MKNLIVVCEYGWIISGIMSSQDSESIKLTNASVVRSWCNGKGIGGLAKVEHKNDYTLDEIGDIEIKASKVLFTIPCEW